MKKTIIAFSLIAGFSFGVFAEDDYKNMPTFADGHDVYMPTADFTAKSASEYTAKANYAVMKYRILLFSGQRLAM